VLAGLRSGGTLAWMKKNRSRPPSSTSNTVIGVVATNARLTKPQATKVAQMAQDGLARVIRPAHTMFDGDTIFALATGEQDADVSMVGAFAAEVMAEAILRAVKMAASAGGLPGLQK
jgi:L-aminopeptidase/D-esterase-like protein